MKIAPMNPPALAKMSDDISRGLTLSLTIHLGIILFFLLKTFLFQEATVDFTQAIRVDIVGMPEKQTTLPPPVTATEIPKAQVPEPSPAPTKPEVQQEVAPPESVKVQPLPLKLPKDTVDLKQIKEAQAKQKEALRKLKNMTAIEKIQKELEKEKLSSIQGAAGAKVKPVPIKGNVLAPGTELVGLDRAQHESYVAALDRHVKQFWSLPEWLNRKGYQGVLIVRIDELGRVISRELVKSSGNPSFDESMLATVDQANPLPPPPEKLSAKVRVEGIKIGFGE